MFIIMASELQAVQNFVAQLELPWVRTNPIMQVLIGAMQPARQFRPQPPKPAQELLAQKAEAQKPEVNQ